MGGGLGGGSSDAAAALIALNQLWELGIPLAELTQLAAGIGSDVPFFLIGGSGILRGRGERIEPVDVNFKGYIVLMMPGFAVTTADVYAAWRPGTREARPVEPPAVPEARTWMERAFNDLEPAAQAVCPTLASLMTQATQLAGRPVRMSGSGSTLFTAFDSSGEAAAFAGDAGGKLNIETRVVRVAASRSGPAPQARMGVR
jgi:4-diphosphocytidyl-2-C-methyl-D-erythritol kinase